MIIFQRATGRVCVVMAFLFVVTFLTTSHANVIIDPLPPKELPDVGATAPLTSVAYSPDGSVLYTLGTTGELIGRSVADKSTFIRDNVGDGAVKMCVLSNGSLLIGYSNGDISHYKKGQISASFTKEGTFPAPKPRELPADSKSESYSLSSEIEDFVPSPDGRLLAVAITQTTWKISYQQKRRSTRNAILQVWDMRNQKLVHRWEPISLTLPPRNGRLWSTLHLAWENEGKTLDVALPDVAVQRFDPFTGVLQSEWKPSTKDAVSLDPAAEDAEAKRRLAKLRPGLREKAQQAYDGKKERNTTPTALPIFGQTQAISADGKWLVSITNRGWKLWNITSNSNLTLENTERLSSGSLVNFSADGSMLAAYSGSWFSVWKNDGQRMSVAQIPSVNFSGMAFSPQGKYLAIGDDAGVARQWNVASPLSAQNDTIFPGFFEPWRQLSITPHLALAATDQFVAKLDEKGRLNWFDYIPIQTPQPLSAFDQKTVRVYLDHLAAAPDGKSWAESVYFKPYTSTMAGENFPGGELRMRDAATGQILWKQVDEGYSRLLRSLQFLMDGTLLTGGRTHGRSASPTMNSFEGLQARAEESGDPVLLNINWEEKVGYRRSSNIEMLLASKDGKRLVISSRSGGEGIQVVDLDTKKIVISFGAHSTIQRGAWALSPDGKWLGVAAEEHIDLWNLDESRSRFNSRPTAHLDVASTTQTLSFGTGNKMAVGLQDGRLLLWKLDSIATKEPLWQVQPTTPKNTINTLQFSPDGTTLWSGDERGDLKARNAENGEWQSTLRLLPPIHENSAPSWARWTRDGKIEAAVGN